jgi:phosphatidylglycerol:prolipoprotein diacylglycerol transferase
MFYNFLHTFHPSPIVLQLGPITIYWYGLLIVLAILAGLALTLHLARQYKISRDEIWNLSFYLIVFGLISARLFHLFYLWPYYWKDSLAIFRVWEGGLSIHGAIVGGIIATLLYCFIAKKRNAKHQKINLSFWFLADLLAPALVLGQAIGRWGNYFNQELYGQPTNLAWGIPIDFFNRTEGFSSFAYFHPTFLYESIWCFAIFLILLFLHKQRIRKISEAKKNYHALELGSKSSEVRPLNGIIASGFIFLIYLILYSFGRFFIEFIRIDPQPVFFSLRLGQWFSLLMILFVVVMIMTKRWWCLLKKSELIRHFNF